jgi:hypothetical protein
LWHRVNQDDVVDWVAKILKLGQFKLDAKLFEDAVDEFFGVHAIFLARGDLF